MGCHYAETVGKSTNSPPRNCFHSVYCLFSSFHLPFCIFHLEKCHQPPYTNAITILNEPTSGRVQEKLSMKKAVIYFSRPKRRWINLLCIALFAVFFQFATTMLHYHIQCLLSSCPSIIPLKMPQRKGSCYVTWFIRNEGKNVTTKTTILFLTIPNRTTWKCIIAKNGVDLT